MIALKQKLETYGFESRITNNDKYYRLFITGRKSIKAFINWIYQDKDLYIKRKYAAFPDQNVDINALKDRIKTYKNSLDL